MSARKIEILQKVSLNDEKIQSGEIKKEEKIDTILVSQSPVVKNGFKGLIEQVFQFVSVGGDFV
jgi:hypothetical protein